MFLKSLILRGFKTFADLTEIEFPADAKITAVVGPNGCGKSNVMDATRWSLGEDNPREIRVASLADIIFAGTAARKGISLAEVTLVFDNTAGRLPVAFSEVAIKRRAFREGASEFFINKTPCRLKDIKDLLLDTGLGESSYSIMTQGQVDAILSSKGEERRAVFEEAAGINKYKTRKVAAEKKLIAAEQNTLRINDLKVEVGERLTTLESQAKRAREYLDIQQQVRELDIGLSRQLLAGILEKRESLFKELEAARALAQTKLETEARENEELTNLKNRYRALELEIDELLAKLDQDKDRLRDIELDRRFTEGEVERSKRSLADLDGKLNDARKKIFKAKEQLESGDLKQELARSAVGASLTPLLDQLNELTKLLSSIFNHFSAEKNISLSLNTGPDRQEAYKVKLEMLEEEELRLKKEKEQLEFGLQAHLTQLTGIMEKSAGAGETQTSLDLLNQKKQEKAALLEQIGRLEEKLRAEDQADRAAQGNETRLEVAIAKLEGEMEAIRDRFSLEYNLTLEELAAQPYSVEQPGRAKKEIESGKARLRELEPVNLLAIEEFDRESERLSFINQQLADLNSARENLQSLITELDLKAQEDFVNTMKQLSEVFSDTFSRLFKGGEARIALAQDQPALEAEVEISVRPNGRKWLPLPLLSGGERALSAIAILFSLLKIRPSPFVFMDEVDAPLDDANIGRFTSLLKEFSQHSQIIVITHNKNTMAVADNIYGVTMEEPGVSKVISMKLAEAAV